jgi:RNA recognition motif-containing protein
MSKKLYVGNVSFDSTEPEIRELFEPFGPIVDLYLPIDKYTGNPRGFVFVTLENASSADEAIEKLNGQEFGGRNLKVNEAEERRERSGGGGGGYGGGGGGGNRGDGGGGRSRRENNRGRRDRDRH